MKLLVADAAAQNPDRDGPRDFSFTITGEFVYPASAVCRHDRPCGCGRAWVGVSSGRATTTARVVEVDARPREVARTLRRHLTNTGYLDGLVGDERWGAVQVIAAQMQALGRDLPVGTVVRRQDDGVYTDERVASC